MDICPQCHTPVDQEHSFCSNCRFPLLLVAGKYRIEGVIGEGGFGMVYRARHVHLEHHAVRVVKVIRPELVAKHQTIKERFWREVQTTILASRDNPHIVHLYDDFGDAPGLGLFFVMEFLDGKPLSVFLRDPNNLPPLVLVCHILTQVCEAMHAAHQQGIIHRDLKPDNIMLVQQQGDPFFVKVLDFGIAKPMHVESDLTQSGLLGTPLYMSPEQLRGSREITLDGRSDIYSLGCILCELLLGRPPFNAPNESPSGLYHVIANHLQQPPPVPSQERPDRQVPAELDQIVARALAKDPNSRYQSMEEFRQALLPLLLRLREQLPAGAQWAGKPLSVTPNLTPASGVASVHPATPPPAAEQAPSELSLAETMPPSEQGSGNFLLPTGVAQTPAPNLAASTPATGSSPPGPPAEGQPLPPEERAGAASPGTQDFVRSAQVPLESPAENSASPATRASSSSSRGSLWRNFLLGLIFLVLVGGGVFVWQSGLLHSQAGLRGVEKSTTHASKLRESPPSQDASALPLAAHTPEQPLQRVGSSKKEDLAASPESKGPRRRARRRVGRSRKRRRRRRVIRRKRHRRKRHRRRKRFALARYQPPRRRPEAKDPAPQAPAPRQRDDASPRPAPKKKNTPAPRRADRPHPRKERRRTRPRRRKGACPSRAPRGFRWVRLISKGAPVRQIAIRRVGISRRPYKRRGACFLLGKWSLSVIVNGVAENRFWDCELRVPARVKTLRVRLIRSSPSGMAPMKGDYCRR